VKHTFAIAIGLAVSLLAATAEVRADELEGSFVRAHADEMLEGALTDDQADSLQLIAYQVAAAAACEGIDLDAAKFEAAFAKLAPVDAAKMTEPQKAYFDQHLLVVYGVMVGGALATFSDDTAEACDTARTAKADPAMTEDLVWK
jgi:hypothetical protein